MDSAKRRDGAPFALGVLLACACVVVIMSAIVGTLASSGSLVLPGSSTNQVHATAASEKDGVVELVADGSRYAVDQGEDERTYITRSDLDAASGDAVQLFPVAGDVSGIAFCEPRYVFAVVNDEQACSIWRYEIGAHAKASEVARFDGEATSIACEGSELLVTDTQGKAFEYDMLGE